MVNTYINPDYIEGGRALLKALDEARVKINAAFWLYDAETQRWELNLYLPNDIKAGPRHAYLQIDQVLESLDKQHNPLKLTDINAIESRQPVLKALKSAFKVKGIGEIRLTGNMINGQFIEDALIYRMV